MPESERLDPIVSAAAGALRRPVALDPALDERVMAAVIAEPLPQRSALQPMGDAASDRGSLRQAWRWLRRPRTVQLSPLGGLAATTALAAALTLFVRSDGAERDAQAEAAVAATAPAEATTSTSAPAQQVVQFVLVAPGASTVSLVGDFNDWQVGATPLRPVSSGRVWAVNVPLTEGRHRYAFVVDEDEWVADPTAPRAPGNDFGTPSSVVTVAERRS